MSSPSRDEVAAAAARRRPYLRRTPVMEVEGADLGRPGPIIVCGGNTEAVDFDRPARIA